MRQDDETPSCEFNGHEPSIVFLEIRALYSTAEIHGTVTQYPLMLIQFSGIGKRSYDTDKGDEAKDL